MADDQTTAAPAPGIDYSALTPEMINGLLARATQPLPNIQPDQTPVDHSGFWGGLRHGISLLGEFAGSPGPETLKALSPAEREQAGFQALSRFGTGLMAASHYVPGQTFGSNLAQGFQAAERGYDTTARQAAGLLGAQQAYAIQNQQGDLAKLKEVIPLLQLQANQRAVAGVPYTVGGGGKPGTAAPGTSIATGGSIAPFVATNLPEGITPAEDQIVRTVIGEAANQGTVGQQGVVAVIKNRMEAGKQNAQDVIFAPNQFEPWNNPKTRAGLEAIDPASKAYQDVLNNAVRPVMSGSAKDPTGGATHFYSPTAQDKLGREPPSWAAGQTPTVIGQHNFYKLPYGAPQGPAAPPSAPGQTAMAPVGTQPTNTPVQIPPVALPAPVQTAGPGAPTAVAAPPPAGAPGASIAAPPSQTTIEPKTGAPVFRYTPSQIPPGLIPSGTFTPDQQQAVKTIQDAYVHERQVALTPADVQKAESNFGTNMTKVLGSQTDAAKVATDALLKFHEADFKQQQDTHAKVLADFFDQQKFAREDAAKQAAVAQAHKNALEAKTAEQEGSVVVEDQKRFATERDGARKSIDNLQTLRALSEAAEISGPLDRVTLPGGITGRDLMANAGLGTEEQRRRWSGQQAFEAFKNNVIVDLRAGIAMGQLSDRDLQFIQNMGPDLIQRPKTRSSIINILETAQSRKRDYIDNVNQLYESGMPWTKAKREANKAMPEVVPQVPTGLTTDQRIDFFRQHIPKGSIFRGPDSMTHDGKPVRGDIMIAPMVGY